MKKIIALMLVMLACSLNLSAMADTNKLGQEYTIDEECSFTVKDAKPYDIFFNQNSGNSKQWIVVGFDLLNWRNDQFFVKTETGAKIVYDDDFEFEADYLWALPVGTYYRSTNEHIIDICAVEDGEMQIGRNENNQGGLYNSTVTSADYSNFFLKWTNTYYYDPNQDMFIAEPERDNSYHFVSQDSSKTVLDPLVRRTYHYVFLVPDIVAEEEGNRELIFTVCDEEFSFRF